MAENGKKTIALALNRVEGDLELKIEHEDGVVTNAWSRGVMYRGFENMLKGRGARDGLVLTPRVCGICGFIHSTCYCQAVEKAIEEYRRLIEEQAARTPAKPMKRLAAGSWVYGTLSTWIGHADKNTLKGMDGGDTLFGIARRYGVSVAELSAANPGLDGLKPGQTLSEEEVIHFCKSRLAAWGTSCAPKASAITARKAGSRLKSTTVWNVARESARVFFCASQTTITAIRIPVRAPAVSIARCKPNASPRRSAGTLAASSASRGEERSPLPTRSAKRIASSHGQLPTNAINGRPSPASP